MISTSPGSPYMFIQVLFMYTVYIHKCLWIFSFLRMCHCMQVWQYLHWCCPRMSWTLVLVWWVRNESCSSRCPTLLHLPVFGLLLLVSTGTDHCVQIVLCACVGQCTNCFVCLRGVVYYSLLCCTKLVKRWIIVQTHTNLSDGKWMHKCIHSSYELLLQITAIIFFLDLHKYC